MALRNTIQEIKIRDNDLEAIAANRDQFLSEWKSDVEELYQKIMTLLRDFTEDGTIKFFESNKSVKESELGEYSVTELRISIASRMVVTSPIARLVSGGTGRIDLFRSDRPTEKDRVSLLRSVGDPSKTYWAIERKTAEDAIAINRFVHASALAALSLSGQARKNYRPLDKEGLEDALDFLLKI